MCLERLAPNMAAKSSGMDRVEFRRRNLSKKSPQPRMPLQDAASGPNLMMRPAISLRCLSCGSSAPPSTTGFELARGGRARNSAYEAACRGIGLACYVESSRYCAVAFRRRSLGALPAPPSTRPRPCGWEPTGFRCGRRSAPIIHGQAPRHSLGANYLVAPWGVPVEQIDVDRRRNRSSAYGHPHLSARGPSAVGDRPCIAQSEKSSPRET